MKEHEPIITRLARCFIVRKGVVPSFKAMRRRWAQHPIEDVGERLRAMMPWIAEKRLVDKSKN